jgi:hypothetical protein
MTNTIQWIFVIVGIILLIPILAKLRWVLTGLSKSNEFMNNKPIIILGIFGLMILIIAIFLL